MTVAEVRIPREWEGWRTGAIVERDAVSMEILDSMTYTLPINVFHNLEHGDCQSCFDKMCIYLHQACLGIIHYDYENFCKRKGPQTRSPHRRVRSP